MMLLLRRTLLLIGILLSNAKQMPPASDWAGILRHNKPKFFGEAEILFFRHFIFFGLSPRR